MICNFLDWKSPKGLFNISDALREGTKVNKRRKRQAPPKVLEADVHEDFYLEIETDSEERDYEVSDEDLVSDQDFAKSRETSSNAISSVFSVFESKRTLNLTTDTLDCDNILVNQKNDSVLKTVCSQIPKSKVPTKDVESRQTKGLPGYASRFEKLSVDKETQLVCHKRKLSPEQICLPQKSFIEAFKTAHDHRLSGQPGSEKVFCL